MPPPLPVVAPARLGPPPPPSARVSAPPGTASAINTAELERLRRAVLQAQSALHKAESDRERFDRERRAAESQLTIEVSARRNAESEHSSARATVERQNSELERRAARILELEARLRELEESVFELAALRTRCAELEARSNEARPSESEVVPSAPARLDDLQEIRGIGPAFARTLRARGVLTFAQVAAWTDSDIAEIAKALRIQVARIHNQDWVGSAKALLSAAPPGQ